MRQRVVLANLLMAANQVVTVEKLIDAVWDDSPPPSARGQIQICISALRRALCSPELIDTNPLGYSIRVSPDQLDYLMFDDALARGRAAAANGQLDAALTHLDRAIDIWSGPALAGVSSRAAEVVAYRLEERRIMALEDRAEIRLGLGGHRELVEELVALTNEYPLRERLWGFRMLALYRSGRQAEALETYRTARTNLVGELGIEPSQYLRHLERAILAQDTSLSGDVDDQRTEAATDVRRPQQLPADLPDFVGHAALIDSLITTLTSGDANRVPIAVVTGAPGGGKTSLALHVAHLLRTTFANGSLYACLYGSTAQPRSTDAVLSDLLHGLGLAATAIPIELEQRINLLRSQLATRRLLIVLDDVGSEDQIAGLLPGVPGPAVLITSRRRLAGIPGVQAVDVGMMSADESLTLLGRICGEERVAAASGAAAELSQMCGGLPLAVRIAGVRLAAHPHWAVSTLLDRLRDERSRLDELSHGDVAVRSLLADVYESLSPTAKTLFWLLSALEIHEFSAWTAAALLDCDTMRVGVLLDELADVRLLDAHFSTLTRQPRYRFHELVRVFASEHRLAQDDEAACVDAVERSLGALLAFSEEAHQRLHGGRFAMLRGTAPRWAGAQAEFDRFLGDPMAWFDEERITLEVAISQAAELKLDELCWELAVVSVTMYERRGLFADWRASHNIALAATDRAGNRRGQAAVLASLGSLGVAQHTEDDGEFLLRAMELFEAVGDQIGSALTLRNLAHLDRIQGRPGMAVQRYEQALEKFRATGDLVAQAHVLSGLARSYLDFAAPERAEALAKESLVLSEKVGNRRLQAQALHRLGEVFADSKQALAAKAVFQEALDLARTQDDRVGQSYALNGLGGAMLEQNDLTAAEIHFSEVVDICRSTNERNALAHALFGLGRVYASRGECDSAERFFVQAANAFAMQENGPWHTRSLEEVGAVRRAAGRLVAGTGHPTAG
jgi:DNA-binding SARP family transcriptional activator